MGPDFVFGFVQAVDGERDPRNLLLAFQIARNLIVRGYDFSEYRVRDAHLYVPSLIVSDCNTNVSSGILVRLDEGMLHGGFVFMLVSIIS